jgi:hypothetical protein
MKCFYSILFVSACHDELPRTNFCALKRIGKIIKKFEAFYCIFRLEGIYVLLNLLHHQR